MPERKEKVMDKYLPNVWKFHDFSITQILREINFWDSRSAKSAILTHLEVLNFASYEIMHFLKAQIHQFNQKGKNDSFTTSRFSKIDFT